MELDWGGGHGQVAAQIEGHADGAAACADEARELLGGGATTQQEPPSWWGTEPPAPSALLKVTHADAALPRLLGAITHAEQASGLRAALRGSPAVGVGQLGLSPGSDEERPAAGEPGGRQDVAEAVVRFTDSLRAEAGTFGGSVVLLEAPPGVREQVDPWGPVGGLDLMRAVKAQFDPGRLLAPGRFVGGI